MYYKIHSWLNPQMQNHEYKGPTVTLFSTAWGGSVPVTLVVQASTVQCFSYHYCLTVVAQSLSCVQVFVTPWTAAC